MYYFEHYVVELWKYRAEKLSNAYLNDLMNIALLSLISCRVSSSVRLNVRSETRISDIKSSLLLCTAACCSTNLENTNQWLHSTCHMQSLKKTYHTPYSSTFCRYKTWVLCLYNLEKFSSIHHWVVLLMHHESIIIVPLIDAKQTTSKNWMVYRFKRGYNTN